jgi:hypothetical protein
MKYLFLLLSIATFISCTEQSHVLPSPSGRAGEVLVVMNDKHWEAPSGQLLSATFAQDVAGLPWSEPVFDISRLPRPAYNDMVRIARNVVDVEVGDRYSVTKVKFYKEKFSRTQAYVKIQAPDEASLYQAIKQNEMRLLSFFYTAERERLVSYFAKNKSDEYTKKVKEVIGYELVIPSLFNRDNFSGTNFVWLTGRNMEARTDLALYTFPCPDEAMITVDYLIAKRDSAMKVNIAGPSEGAYIRTAEIISPVLTKIDRKAFSLYEVRGLWETTVDFMGGPFVSYAYYDAQNKQVKVLEGFVYAPHKDKRNLIRRLEAVAYSWKPKK